MFVSYCGWSIEFVCCAVAEVGSLKISLLRIAGSYLLMLWNTGGSNVMFDVTSMPLLASL